jgi:gluconolactonase
MNRRAFLAASAATATLAGVKTAAANALPLGPLPDMRYPDVRIESADKKFFGTKFPAFAGTAGVERVATGFRWAEGPAFSREGNYLVFSDIPNNRMMRLLWDDNHLSVFREPSNNSNGNTIDPQGRLVTCEHRTRRVSRTELDGTITVVADKYNGKRLDLVHRPDLRHRRQLRRPQAGPRAGQALCLPRRRQDRRDQAGS